MTQIFQGTTVNKMALRNRLVRSATWEGMCEEEGRPTERLADLYRELARGRIGLIISGYTYVSTEGKQMPGKMGLYSDDFAGEMKALTDAVHEEDGRICVQLVHAGGQTSTETAGRQPLAPSSVEVAQFPEVPAAMTRHDIDRVAAAFGEAAGRAKEYGFDAVQLHGAHGYLINQFLSPLTNRREDEYGGSLENRSRFMREVCRLVRGAVGTEFPLLIKLNGSDFLEGGLDEHDALAAARALAEEGIDAIEVSGGTGASGKQSPVRTKIKTVDEEAYHLSLADGIRKEVSCPVMTVGGFRSFKVADDAIERGETDLVSLARPLIREPDLPRRWEEGDRRKAECISCNGCFKPGLKEGGIYCVVKRAKEEGREVPD